MDALEPKNSTPASNLLGGLRDPPDWRGRRQKATFPATRGPSLSASPSEKLWRYTKLAIKSSVAVFLLVLSGFFGFLYQAKVSTGRHAGTADAIVAFSGDPQRVRTAGLLLAEGHARQLLVVGQDNGEDTLKLRIKYPALSACCIRTNALSRTTSEDASLAQKWIIANGAHSVILVTSAFHVPRAMIELRRALPSMAIEAIGVGGTTSAQDSGDKGAANTHFLIREYFKYVAASVPGLQSLLRTNAAQRITVESAEMGARRTLGFAILALLMATLSFAVIRWKFPPGEASVTRRRRPRSRHSAYGGFTDAVGEMEEGSDVVSKASNAVSGFRGKN